MNICVIVQSFPTKKTIDYIFVEQLCRQLVEKGITVNVIAPQSLTKCIFRKIPIVRYKAIVKWDKYSYVLYRPKYISLGNRFKKFLRYNEIKAVERVCAKENLKPDIFYGHFWSQIYSVFKYAKRNNIPLTGAIGEESITIQNLFPQEDLINLRKYVKKVICVSSKSRDESVAAGLIAKEDTYVIPNAIDNKLFYPKDKKSLREKYGFSESDFIVAFVGQFNDRKGVKRLSDALNLLKDKTIKAFFIGTGKVKPDYDHTLIEGTIPHDLLPEYLSMADVFVLPTTNEGCCNAIIEAMACQLPIISSNCPFNWDILNKENSILIDPMNVSDIAQSINLLKNDEELREKLGNNALNTVQSLTLSKRTDRIIVILKSLLNK